MADKKYYWFKMEEGFFNDKAIKRLRRIAGGDTFTIIYLKMILKSLRDEGKLYFEGYYKEFTDELAMDIDEDEENVRVTVEYLIRNGLLIESEETESVELTQVPKLLGSETASAERMRRMRQRNDVTEERNKVTHHVTQQLQTCYTDIDIEKEKDIRDRDTYRSKDTHSDLEEREITFKTILTAWNALSSYGIKPITRIAGGSTRAKAVQSVLNQYSLDEVLSTIEKIKDSSYLTGHSKSGWRATFDWFSKPDNFVKVLEGNYDDHEKANSLYSDIDAWVRQKEKEAQAEEGSTYFG